MKNKILKISLTLLVIFGFYFSFQIENPSIVLANSSEWEIQHFRLFTNKRLAIVFKHIKTGKIYTPIIQADIGRNKFAEIGEGREGDKKTPKGSWKIVGVRGSGMPSTSIYNQSGVALGPAIFYLDIRDPITNKDRTIGIHGSKHGTVGSSTTAGCIQIKNSDMEVLYPFIKPGIPVVIGDEDEIPFP